MKKKLLVITISILTVLAGVYGGAYLINRNDTPQSTLTEVKKQPLPTVTELLTLVNAERAKAGVKPLVEDSRLDQSAQFKADEMSATNMLSHTDKDGVHGYTYIAKFGKKCNVGGENIFWDGNVSTSSLSAIDWWMHSKKHREAILDSANDTTGIGISRFQNGFMAVEHFCDE